jgi:hypothetical protein
MSQAPQIPANRVARALQSVNNPVECPRCGSIFFYELNASMYTQRGSSALSGVSITPQRIYVCLCGKIQELPGYQTAPAGSERDLFNQSFKLALEVEYASDVDVLSQNLVGLSEFNKQTTRISKLEAKFDSVLTGGDLEETEEEKVDLDVLVPKKVSKKKIEVDDIFAPKPENELPLVASGTRGRSQLSAEPDLGIGKQITIPSRAYAPGGAERLRKKNNT